MASKDFLVEIGTEELPPKALQALSSAFSDGIVDGLAKAGLKCTTVQAFATPRRLAVLVCSLDEAQADKSNVRFGPAVTAAYDAEGKATAAANGFAKSCDVDISELSTADKDGVEKLCFSQHQQGKATASLLPDIVSNSLSKLPIPKRMRWGSSRDEFVRPVHWLVLLFGKDIVEAQILGLSSGRRTRGHRFHCNESIDLSVPGDYENLLESKGQLIPDFEKRKRLILQLVNEEGEKLGATPVIDSDLLNEVTSLVEYPVALTGNFDKRFLQVPAEALIYAMKSHQKCFYLVDANQKLLPHFIAVSNIISTDPAQVIQGNERVIRPRLADAEFFFSTDKKQSLESRQEQLKTVVFQQQLGTVYEKSQRVALLAVKIAADLNFDQKKCERAAQLAKCDLVTNMVGEFAELQGLMGFYYATNDGEDQDVAQALNEQYLPRFSGDDLPHTDTGTALALAEKLDTMAGMFAIGKPPTGSKDPFALRRSALGILRILIEKELGLNLLSALNYALYGFSDLIESAGKHGDEVSLQLFDFLLERFRAWYQDAGISSQVYQAVLALRPEEPLDFNLRVLATSHFSSLPEAESLASANKRVANLLAKENVSGSDAIIDESLLEEPSEVILVQAVKDMEALVSPLFTQRKYTQGLQALTKLNKPVDAFFKDVLVISDDPRLKANRLAILQRLRDLFLGVADISFLGSS